MPGYQMPSAWRTPAKRPRTKLALRAYLAEHPRYWTMAGHNASTSYARCVKVHRQGWNHELETAAFAVLELSHPLTDSGFSDPLDDFQRAYQDVWQWGTHGRSSGYVVLYQGGRRPSAYQSYCEGCGQGNCRPATETDRQCGRCGWALRHNPPQPRHETFSYPGRGVDDETDFADWSRDALAARAAVVWDFDQAVAAGLANFQEFCRSHRVVEQTIYQPVTIKVAEPREA